MLALLLLLALPAVHANCSAENLLIDEFSGNATVCVGGTCDANTSYECVFDTDLDSDLCCKNNTTEEGGQEEQGGGQGEQAGGQNCTDNTHPRTGRSDCAANARLCNNTMYFDLMTEQCPKTCNRCPGTPPAPAPAAACEDKKNAGGGSDCAKNAHLCNNTMYFDLMTAQCPATCNRCPGVWVPPAPGPCADKPDAKCTQNKALCTNSLYADLMAQQCPQTCGKC